MSEISALPSGIAKWLSEQKEQLPDITFITEYPPEKKAIPLKKAIVAIGLNQVSITDSFVDDGTGVLVKQEYCRSADLRISLAIHVPFSHGGAACHDVFTNIIDCLTFASDLNIEESGCGNVIADRDTDAFVLEGFIMIKADFCPAISSDLNFKTFEDHQLLCGSHISDPDVHVSADEKDRWNNSFDFGMFTGDGRATRTINIGFRPRFVIVFEEDAPPCVYDPSETYIASYCGFAMDKINSMGVSLAENGFTVYNGESHEYLGAAPYLNRFPYSYAFFAMK